MLSSMAPPAKFRIMTPVAGSSQAVASPMTMPSCVQRSMIRPRLRATDLLELDQTYQQAAGMK